MAHRHLQNGSEGQIVAACLQRSFIWPRLKQLALRINMRVQRGDHGTAAEFVRWVKSVPYDPAKRPMVAIPSYINQPATIEDLIEHVYPRDRLQRASQDHATFDGRCLLATLNATVTEVNKMILDRLPGQEKTYQSVNTHVTDADTAEDHHIFPAEVLQSMDIPSMPPSQLDLKIGTPVMLLRNICPMEGLCNGSRMVVTQMQRHCVQVKMLGGDFDGELRLLPLIIFIEEDTPLGIIMSRKQLPVRLCFAMTINKAQGQSFHTVGLDSRAPVFSHGQLYVGLSRTSSVEGLAILLPPESEGRTKNVIYPEVLPSDHPPVDPVLGS